MKPKRLQLLWGALFLIYLGVLLKITVFRSGFWTHPLYSGRIEWVPFLYLAELVRRGDWSYFIYLFGGNILWFVPFGWYFRLREKPLWMAALLGFGFSLTIELSQFVLGTGVTEVEDLILNTLGVLLGFGLGCLWKRPASPGVE